MLGRCQGRGLAGGFTDGDRRHAGIDLTFAERRECRQINLAGLIERRGKIGDIARQPTGGIGKGIHGLSRRVFHLTEALSIGGKHEALRASYARFDLETHLLQP